MARPKPFTWSYSKLKNFDVCEFRHQQIDLLNNFKEVEENDGPLAWGNKVHKAMAKALKGEAALPDSMELYQPWLDKVKNGPGDLLIEQKYAISNKFQATDYYAPNVWYRGIADVVRIHGRLGLGVDWKTGKFVDDPIQLALMAQCLFAHFPQLTHVRADYIWLQEDDSTTEVFTRNDMKLVWNKVLPRVAKMEEAHNTGVYKTKPCKLCKKHCIVSSCDHYQKSSY